MISSKRFMKAEPRSIFKFFDMERKEVIEVDYSDVVMVYNAMLPFGFKNEIQRDLLTNVFRRGWRSEAHEIALMTILAPVGDSYRKVKPYIAANTIPPMPDLEERRQCEKLSLR